MSAPEQANTLEKRITELEQENKRLHDTVDYLTRKLYGSSSEKTSAILKGQMSIFDEAESSADQDAMEPKLDTVETLLNKKYKGQRKDSLKNLPHDRVVFKLHDEDLLCPQCNTPLVPVGEEFIRTEVEYIPAKLRVIDYFRETYECRSCKKDKPYFEKATMPYPVIMHSYASPATIAHVMYQKFVNAMPLYRQHGIKSFSCHNGQLDYGCIKRLAYSFN